MKKEQQEIKDTENGFIVFISIIAVILSFLFGRYTFPKQDNHVSLDDQYCEWSSVPGLSQECYQIETLLKNHKKHQELSENLEQAKNELEGEKKKLSCKGNGGFLIIGGMCNINNKNYKWIDNSWTYLEIL